MVFIFSAAEASGCVDLRVRSVDLGFELPQETFTFFFQGNRIRISGSRNWRRRDGSCGYTFWALTNWASLQISGVIGLTLRAWEAIADALGPDQRC
jgi:hypothetical protein